MSLSVNDVLKQTTRITTENLYPQQEKRAMKKNLNKAEEDNMNEMDEKIKKAFQQVEDNKKCRD